MDLHMLTYDALLIEVDVETELINSPLDADMDLSGQGEGNDDLGFE